MNIKTKEGIGIGLEGTYRVQVVDSTTSEVVKDYGWNKNMITNTGMDYVASSNIADLMYYAAIGTGSRPNSLDFTYTGIAQSSSSIGIIVSGEIGSFTSPTASYSAAVQAGDVIIDSDFSQSNVLSVIPTILTVDTNYNYDGPKAFSVLKTSQTTLKSEIHRSSTFYPGSSSAVGFNCGTVTSGNGTYNLPSHMGLSC